METPTPKPRTIIGKTSASSAEIDFRKLRPLEQN